MQFLGEVFRDHTYFLLGGRLAIKKKFEGLLFYIFFSPTESKEAISRQGLASPASAGSESSFISTLIEGTLLSSGDLGMKLSQLVTLHALLKQERYCFHI